MERTAGYIVCATSFHRHKFAYNLLNTSGIHYALYGLRSYHKNLQKYYKKVNRENIVNAKKYFFVLHNNNKTMTFL